MANTRTTASKTTTPRKTTTTTTRKPRTTKPKVEEPKVELQDVSVVSEPTDPNTEIVYSLPEDPVQRQALVDSYWNLKQVGIEVPDAVRIPVEAWIASVQEEQEAAITAQEQEQNEFNAKIEELNANGPTYVRNRTNTPFNLRLDSQQGGNNGSRPRRLELKPRGMRGDMHPIKDEDKTDPILLTNLNLGLLELIPAGVAQLIIEKQTHNMTTQRVHPAHQIIQNEYKVLRDNHVNVSENPTIRVEAEFNSQGVTVATLDPRVMQGGFEDKQLSRAGDLSGGLTRVQPGQPEVQSQFIPTNGQPASIQFTPSAGVDSVAARKIKDDIARRKDIHGPAAGLGDIRVVVEPTQKN